MIEVVSSSDCALGESPLWHPVLGCLFWIDIVGRQLHRLEPDGMESRWALPEDPGCIALVAAAGSDPDGSATIATDRLVVTLRSGFHLLRWADPAALRSGAPFELIRLTPPLYDTGEFRFNDGKVDPQGRFWAGTLYEPKIKATGGLYCLERGVARVVTGPTAAEQPTVPVRQWGVTTSNGLAFSPDGSLLYHSDTPAHVVYVHDVDPASGTLLNRRVWWRTDDDRQAPDYGGRPDGAALDVAGCYWTALYEGGRIAQIAPTGEVMQTVAVPARCPTMVSFGGPDLRTLYVTSARHGRSADELAAWPASGRVFALRVPVAGLPQPGYRE